MKHRIQTRSIAALCLVIIFGTTSALGQERDPRLIVDLPNYGDSSIIETRLRGSVHGLDYSISALRMDNRVVFDIIINNLSVRLEIPNSDFPDLDLRTIREGITHESEPATLSFDVEYGNLGGCFGDSRRQKLLISFKNDGLIAVYNLNNDRCSLVWHQLDLVQTAPSVYSIVHSGGTILN